MKIFDKLKNLKSSAQEALRKPKMMALIALPALLMVGYFSLSLYQSGKRGELVNTNVRETKKTVYENKPENADVGAFGKEVSTKSYVAEINRDIQGVKDRMDTIEGKMETLARAVEDIKKVQSDTNIALSDVDAKVTKQLAEGIKKLKAQQNPVTSVLNQVESFATGRPFEPIGGQNKLEIAKVGEIQKEDKSKEHHYVYLPAGSFCKGTLLTGVYAPSDESNPLPALLSINEAFYGPNNSRVPLKGIFAIAKVHGNMVSERALFQLVGISAVFPDGKVFEYEGNVGYVADSEGQLGIPGKVIYNTGKELALNFLSGFMSGATEALSQAQTTVTLNAYGTSNRNVTGNSGKYAMYSGISKSAEGLSQYYEKQLEKMVPAIKIDAGVEITIVMQKGVEIEGLEISGNNYTYIQ